MSLLLTNNPEIKTLLYIRNKATQPLRIRIIILMTPDETLACEFNSLLWCDHVALLVPLGLVLWGQLGSPTTFLHSELLEP